MTLSISEIFYDDGKQAIASGANFYRLLNNTLNKFLTPPFFAKQGLVVDKNGLKSEDFSTIITTVEPYKNNNDYVEVSVDNTACVIAAYENMNLECLHKAYEKIASAKKLRKSIKPADTYRGEILGIICAITANPLEKLAEEIQALNLKYPSEEWPDMIAILTQGTFHYVVQFPGEKCFGDFLLPGRSYLDQPTAMPAMYIIPVLSPTESYTFNKMCGFIFGHLKSCIQNTNLLNFNEVLSSVPKAQLTLPGYQFNLQAQLVPVSPQFYIGKYVPQQPQVFKDKYHKVFFSLNFLPWQDGGIIILNGKIPLQTLLIYLGNKVNNCLSTITRDQLQISSILPITESDYFEMLEKIQKQTNFILQKPGKIIKKIILNEGANSPFVARLIIGILTLRENSLIDNQKKEVFDKQFESFLNSLLEVKEIAQEIFDVIIDYTKEIEEGHIVESNFGSIRITKTIDRKLSKIVKSFIREAVSLLKNKLQGILQTLNVDIGCLFQKPEQFKKGLEKIESSEPNLALYLKNVREKWSNDLVNIRNNTDHADWGLQELEYIDNEASIKINEPEIGGKIVTEFIKFILDRILCFIEDIIFYSFGKILPANIYIIEIPFIQRDKEMPLRFKIGLGTNGESPWFINYNEINFQNK